MPPRNARREPTNEEQTRRTILLVDDSKSFASVVTSVLGEQYNVITCHRPEDALETIEAQHVDILLADLYYDEVETALDGFGLLKEMSKNHPEVPIIVVSRTDDPRDTTRILDLGAFSFVSKHFERDELTMLMDRAIRSRFLERQFEFLRSREAIVEGDIVHKCAAMQRVIEDVGIFAPSNTPILITGETGTGKDLVAKLVHAHSGREGPFHALNIASLSSTLFEAQLFGHERGAFTDARETRPGLIEMSSGGTLFIDEIGSLPVEKQSALLRVIEEGSIRRIGSSVARPINVRFVFATNDDLEDLIGADRFREDLWYRINRLHIHLPALRERENDVLYIAEVLLERLARHRSYRLTMDAREVLLRAELRGNVRELEGLLERAILYDDDGYIDHADLERAGIRIYQANDLDDINTQRSSEAHSGTSDARLDDLVAQIPIDELVPYTKSSPQLSRALRSRLVDHALALHGGNATKAAAYCDVSRPAFYGWLKDLGYDRSSSSDEESRDASGGSSEAKE